MKTTTQWLDAAKKKHGLSDYALAPLLGISRSQMSKYRGGADFLSDDAAIKLAYLLNMESPAEIVASAHAERAKSEDVKAFWSAWAERLGGVAAGFLIAVGATAPTPAPAAQSQSGDGSVYYVKSRRYQKRSTKRSIYPGWLPFFPQTRHA